MGGVYARLPWPISANGRVGGLRVRASVTRVIGDA
jgi:hypothetical protein